MMPGKRPGGHLALGVWLVLMVACVGVIARTQFRTDMGAFLPRSAGMAQQVLTEQVSSGATSHLILLAVSGAPASVIDALSAALAGRLRARAAFTDVIDGDDASFAGARDFVWRNRYLLSPAVTPARFAVAGLRAALVNDLGLLGSDLGPVVQQSLPNDPTGEVMALLRRMDTGEGPASRDGVWVSADGLRALLLVHTRDAGFDIDAQQRDLGAIGVAFEAARGTVPGAAGARLLESGPGVFALHTRDTTKRDVTRLSVLAGAGAVGLLAFAYRSPLVLLLGLLPVASGAVAAVAAVSLAFGFVHGVTLGFGVTLIGESLDYAIYLFTQTARGERPGDTLARIWPTLRLGVVTSVVGFAAMLFSNFIGFAQLGLFSIVGLVAAAGVTRFVLPHLAPRGFFAGGADAISRPLRAVIRHRRALRWVAAGAVLAAGVALALHRGGVWDADLENLSPIPAADQALDQTLRHDLAVPDTRYFVVLKAADEQAALQESEKLATVLETAVARGQLGGFEAPSGVLPSAATQRARQAALPADDVLRARFDAAQVGLPFRANEFDGFFRDVAAAKDAAPLTQADLPPALALQLQSTLVRRGDGWVVMAPLRGVADAAGVAAAVDTAGLPGAAFVDLKHESDRLLASFEREAVTLAVVGSLAVLAVLLVGLRTAARVAAVAAPLAAAVTLTAAMLTWGGGRLSIFMVVGFLLIVAVGSNYCLFFERRERDAAMWRRATASILLANLCTVSAYGIMSLSSIPVLHDIGRTVAVGTFLTLVCAAVFSRPALEDGAA